MKHLYGGAILMAAASMTGTTNILDTEIFDERHSRAGFSMIDALCRTDGDMAGSGFAFKGGGGQGDLNKGGVRPSDDVMATGGFQVYDAQQQSNHHGGAGSRLSHDGNVGTLATTQTIAPIAFTDSGPGGGTVSGYTGLDGCTEMNADHAFGGQAFGAA